ncbi:MAG: mechanosensitive ion channel [Deltaproteobacteria bacterium]|nr:mechanosensitive ion channel [Deltaproteobacteria bacterium]NND30078.1 mechanosensitive ion channel [Myxococcales bacterium]MBT8465856.1 mechanosensitive ion channel [Deltaproteobacteria bacterium]MBT8481786.1 mechanosensitive ion channel [Deltaproteobacteria bacterium]NNK08111.1 mechanosensitive ion channel [Myxococcales bacterium]
MPLDKVYGDVMGKLSRWAESVAEMLPNTIVALLVLVLFWFAARVASGASTRALKRFNTHQAARDLIAGITQLGVLLAGVVVALSVMNLDKALASILAGAGIVGLAIGFAFQDLAGNLISGVGLAIHQRWPFKIGDIVETNDVFGVVEKIHLRTSIIRTLDGKTAIIPNKGIYQNKVLNHSASGTRRIDLECGVSYGDDLEKVHRVVSETLDGIEGRDSSSDVEVFFTGFGSSSISLVGRFWVDYVKHRDFLDAQSRAVVAVKKAFDANDIVIPFPIRTLDFGIRGGTSLAEAFPERGFARLAEAAR